jgi:hypothetical protein
MVEKGGLCGCSRDYGYLSLVSMNPWYLERGDKPTVSLSSSNIFIFAAVVPVAALSPADTILVM